jgi:hypothetical protein
MLQVMGLMAGNPVIKGIRRLSAVEFKKPGSMA